MKIIFWLSCAALSCAALNAVAAPRVEVYQAWVQTPLKGQMTTHAVMTLKANEDARLLALVTPVAAMAQIHQMKIEDGVMKMAALAGGLPLPAGTAVTLASGHYHIMLIDLQTQLLKGDTVPMTLTFVNAQGEQSQLNLQLPVASSTPADTAPAAPMPNTNRQAPAAYPSTPANH